MRNSTMRDTLYSAIYNGAIQGIYSIKWYYVRILDLFENGTIGKQYNARSCNERTPVFDFTSFFGLDFLKFSGSLCT